MFKKYGWKAITLASGALAGLVTQRLLEVAWKAVRGATPPPMPADRRSSWADALSWAIATGVGAESRGLSPFVRPPVMWEATIHETPPEPGLEARAEI